MISQAPVLVAQPFLFARLPLGSITSGQTGERYPAPITARIDADVGAHPATRVA